MIHKNSHNKQTAIIATIFALSFLLLGLSACTTQKIYCQEPNTVIDNTCCLDIDKNNECDPQKTASQETTPSQEISSTSEQTLSKDDAQNAFAQHFADAWTKQDFKEIYTLFTDNYRDQISQDEFVWLAAKKNKQLGITKVNVYRVFGDTIEYDLVQNDPRIKNSARGSFVSVNGKYYHRPFNYFRTLEVSDVCENVSSCILSYAEEFQKPEVCDLAGSQRIECKESFGKTFTFEDERVTCNQVHDYFEKSACILNVSLKYAREDACWDLSQDPQLFTCLGHIAALRQNVELCWEYMKNFTFAGDTVKHAYCIYGYVDQTKDHTKCKKMEHRGNILIGHLEEECNTL